MLGFLCVTCLLDTYAQNETVLKRLFKNPIQATNGDKKKQIGAQSFENMDGHRLNDIPIIRDVIMREKTDL